MNKNLKKKIKIHVIDVILNKQILNVVFMQQYYKLFLIPNQEI